jgi:hypothetical protein
MKRLATEPLGQTESPDTRRFPGSHVGFNAGVGQVLHTGPSLTENTHRLCGLRCPEHWERPEPARRSARRAAGTRSPDDLLPKMMMMMKLEPVLQGDV